MKDLSFIRLDDNFDNAKFINDSPIANVKKYNFIQLATNESYLQTTNVLNGISLGSNYAVHVVNCNNQELLDITNNVFTQEFTDTQGQNQLSFEIVNIGFDFYRKTVFLRFTHTISDAVYWSNPLNITDYNKHKTIFLEYKNYNDYQRIGYTNSQKYQSIRIGAYFDIPVDETEITSYTTTQGRSTSPRATLIRFEQYKIDAINTFGFVRLNTLLTHNLIYLDCVRLTDKVTAQSNEREGNSNIFQTDFKIAKDYNDTKDYEFQIFEGLQVLQFTPQGAYTLAQLPTDGKLIFNNDISLNTGSITIYDSTDSVVQVFTESDITVTDNVVDIENFTDLITVNDSYYVNISQGLFTAIGVDYDGINDNTTWAFTVQDADYSSLDYGSDYLTN